MIPFMCFCFTLQCNLSIQQLFLQRLGVSLHWFPFTLTAYCLFFCSKLLDYTFFKTLLNLCSFTFWTKSLVWRIAHSFPNEGETRVLLLKGSQAHACFPVCCVELFLQNTNTAHKTDYRKAAQDCYRYLRHCDGFFERKKKCGGVVIKLRHG